jgi:uncharacterized protein
MANAGSFVWYELMTRDVVAAKLFYGKAIGWDHEDAPMPEGSYTLFKVGGRQVAGMMALPPHLRDAGMGPFWSAYIGVADVDAGAAKVVRLGGKVHHPPTDIPGVGRFSTVSDPRGALFNLFKPATAGDSNAPGYAGWHELHTDDWHQAFDFYSAMFGWERGEAHDMGPMGTYQLFTIGSVPAGGMFNSPSPARFWLFYFNVDEIDAGARRITGAGGTIRQGPMQVPGGTWVAQAADPQGAAFAVMTPPK